LRRRGNEADGAEPPSDAFEFPDATCGFIVLPDGDGDLHGRREQGDSPQLIMAPLFKSPPDGNRSSCCIAAGEMEKCEARLALGSTGASVAEGAFGKVQFASDEVDHAQFVVRVPGVKEIDRLYRCAIGQRLVSCLVVVAKSPKHLSAVDATIAGYTSDAGRLDDLYPFRGPLEVRPGQQCLGRPAEDLTGCDGPQLTGRCPCEGLVKHGMGLFEPPEAHQRARVEGLADRLDVSLAEAAGDPLRLGGGNRGGAAGGWRAGSWRRTAASRATKGGEGSIPSSSARRFRRRW
jgi:hypothetical protein